MIRFCFVLFLWIKDSYGLALRSFLFFRLHARIQARLDVGGGASLSIVVYGSPMAYIIVRTKGSAMLDILVIVLFSKKIGLWAEKKGYSRGLFRGLVIGAWFTLEVVGVFAGFIAFGNSAFDESAMLMPLLLGILGAGAGIMTMVFVVMALPFRAKPAAVQAAPVQAAPVEAEPERKPVDPWTCPGCGYKNTYRGDRCFNCKKPNPAKLG